MALCKSLDRDKIPATESFVKLAKKQNNLKPDTFRLEIRPIFLAG